MPLGHTNNPRGNPRGSRNAKMTKREDEALDAENTDDPEANAKAIADRGTSRR
jgi:hypothetical protein